MITEASTEVEKVKRDSGLKDSDFTINSLFLNFHNANISSFDKRESNFPEELTLPLQLAIENYFNLFLKKEDNPYILSYGINRRDVESTETAMFQPSSLEFSTSFSNRLDARISIKAKYSGFKFLMMLDGKEPERNQNTGILPNNLFELKEDTSNTVNGVFAIN